MSAVANAESRLGIEALGLSNRSRNVLRRHGIETVQQLLSRSLSQLKKLEGFGDTATWEICGALRRIGFSLNPEPVRGQKPSKASIAYLERLRDEFAMQAMQGLMAMERASEFVDDNGDPMGDEEGDFGTLFVHTRFLAEEAYKIADSMLIARSGGGV